MSVGAEILIIMAITVAFLFGVAVGVIAMWTSELWWWYE